MSGWTHIQQKIVLQSLDGALLDEDEQLVAELLPLPQDAAVLAARQQLDRDPRLLAMEYMPHGDLGSWMEKLVATPDTPWQRPPEKILWSIFLCLWEGCVAMAYPDIRAKATGKDGADARTTQIPGRNAYFARDEEGDRVRVSDSLVHFGLSPSNGKYKYTVAKCGAAFISRPRLFYIGHLLMTLCTYSNDW